MARLSPFPTGQELDGNGNPLAGGKVYTYEAGTSTPKTTYTDADEGTAHANPIILDSEGRAAIWLDSGAYKIRLFDSSDVLVDERDDIVAQDAGEAASFDVSTNTNITSIYSNGRVYASASLTLSLLSVTEAEDGFEFIVRNVGSGSVIIDPDGSETIDDNSTYTLTAGQSARIMCDGDEWYTMGGAPPDDSITNAKLADGDTITKDKIDDDLITTYTDTTVTATDELLFGDVSDSNNMKKDTVQGILDLTPAAKFESALLHVRDEKAAATAGGTFTSAAWQTRVLNTVETNEIAGASLSSNQITLPAGTYYIEASAPAFSCNLHKAKLRNVDDSTDVIIGTVEYTANGAYCHSRSFISGRFTIASGKDFEIQHQCSLTKATTGFGQSAGFSVVEVYTDVKIWKVA